MPTLPGGHRSHDPGRRPPGRAIAAVAVAVTCLTAGACATSPEHAGSPPASGSARSSSPASAGGRDALGPVLLFTRAEGFVHDSIGPAAEALTSALGHRGLRTMATDDPAVFTSGRLADVSVVVFLSTTGDVLDPPEEAALEAWVRNGGAWVGVHAALDAEYGWPFWAELAGARFAGHPPVQQATVHVEDQGHPSTRPLPATWVRTDEWYNVSPDPRPTVHVLATVDEASYAGGTMGADHPVAWCATVGSGRTFVTTMGHSTETWHDELFVAHVVGGIESVIAPGACT